MRGLRAFAALALTLAIVPSAALSKSRIDDKIQQQRAHIHDVHAKLHVKKAQLSDAKARVDSIQSQLAETNRNIASVNGHLGDIQARMVSTRRKLDWNRIQLAAAQATLRRHQEALNRRLVDAYEHGDLGYLDVLLRASSFADFVERWNDVRYLVKANEATIRARKSDEAHVAAIQSGLLGTQTELEGEEAQARQQRLALDGLAAQRKDLLAAADAERSQVQTEVAQLNEMSDAEEAALEQLIREKQAEEEAQREAARRAARLAGIELPPEPGAPGQLMWPVSGPITSPFGWRMHPVYHRMILHRGIDIAVPTGTPVAAAAEGKIIVASYQGDCGNMVAIDHHGGLSTMYCHMSQIFVSVGQEVQRGQAIGAAGATGDATGPHVHFQVMMHGNPVDPMGFLK
ncbi:MAG TPA: peptidoglycan DD-metalloendopeptidase family protein [Candidatus Elarobacter sp.]|jgi:murein DD-endopeptidase MepM/ murein hydrolase activator NlpD|nr:peptidoglycan DD-metalloendopeptidase family protein [Candidatus Elarobacter sp.]